MPRRNTAEFRTVRPAFVRRSARLIAAIDTKAGEIRFESMAIRAGTRFANDPVSHDGSHAW
jgi:hypothetical protein